MTMILVMATTVRSSHQNERRGHVAGIRSAGYLEPSVCTVCTAHCFPMHIHAYLYIFIQRQLELHQHFSMSIMQAPCLARGPDRAHAWIDQSLAFPCLHLLRSFIKRHSRTRVVQLGPVSRTTDRASLQPAFQSASHSISLSAPHFSSEVRSSDP